jgi:hypothetical protein
VLKPDKTRKIWKRKRNTCKVYWSDKNVKRNLVTFKKTNLAAVTNGRDRDPCKWLGHSIEIG